MVKTIENQSKRYGNILYGCYAVNKLLGRGFQRDTYDLDVYSRQPRKHAIQLEKTIDRGVGANISYVEKTGYPEKGRFKTLYRVKLRNEVTEADYNRMPRDIKYTTKRGVRYETLDRAVKKYEKMLREPETGRGFKATIDLGRILDYKLIKRYRK